MRDVNTPTSADAASGMQALARHEIDPTATVTAAWPMPGNAGLSFGCDVVLGDGSRLPVVIRLAPPGVRRSGNTDVLRIVPLLDALATEGVPVAAVRWSTDDERWFGTDTVVQDRLDALPLHMADAALSATVAVPDALEQAVDVLARIHATPPPAGWEEPRSLADEVAFWAPMLGKASDPTWAEAGTALHDALLADLPHAPDVGIFHGDYHTNNVLYDADGTLAAVVDWEISGVGAQLLDLAWLAMFTDPGCWHPDFAARMRVTADAAWLRERYEKAGGRSTAGFGWFRALACYRFGVISVFNVRLHRTGRRVDATWEDRALSILPLFERGLAFLREEA
jgi:aminoglycoside phosphotransferase (APT) family kinase protein